MLLCSLLGFSLPAIAAPPAPSELPTGGQVSAGQISITQSGQNMAINQATSRGVIDWQTFNVGAQAQVNFVQPSAASVTLNRVQDINPSQIFGRITANGQVFLTNPNGVYFSPSATVDVGGLVATTHSISNADFMAGKNGFARNGSNGSVINEGQLKAALGGYIALLAPEVRNNGVIIAQMGTVAMVAGESITLNFAGNNSLAGITVTPSQIKALVENKQAVMAPGGLIILSARSANSLLGGVVNNSGRLEASGLANRGGKIFLEASSLVNNSGSITANAGNATVAADGTLLAGGPAGSIAINAPQIINSGEIAANAVSVLSGGGSIQMDAANIVQTATGRIDVSYQRASTSGTILLQATQDIILAGSINASAEGVIGNAGATGSAIGGDITILAGNNVELQSAVLDASGGDGGGRIHVEGGNNLPSLPPTNQPNVNFLGATELRVNSRRGSAGSVTVTGDNISLQDNARIDATGATGGGTINVGGGWQGSGNIPQATTVTIAKTVVLDASAIDSGNGGTVVAWSDIHNVNSQTRAYGTFLAKGGLNGGNGGRIETSGYWVDVAGITANASAAYGTSGMWLLDPYNLTISAAATTATTALGPPYSFSSGVAGTNVLNTDIQAQLNAGTSVTLQTTGVAGDGFGNGDINVNANIAKTAGAAASLTLVAHNDIVISANVGITSTVGALNVTLNSDSDTTGGGMIWMQAGSSITSNGGAVTLGGGTNGFAQGHDNAGIYSYGIMFGDNTASGATITSAGGDVTIRGRGAVANGTSDIFGLPGCSFGIFVLSTTGLNVNSGTGRINIHGVSPQTAGVNAQGLQLDGIITSASTALDAITITGDASAVNNAGWAIGADLRGTIQTTAGGGITITGTGGATTAASGSFGIVNFGLGDILSNSGAITLTGTAGNGVGAIDIYQPGFLGQNAVSAASSSNITLNANTLALLAADRLQSTGALTIQPRTAGTTVGIGGAAGTLQLASSYFSTNFVNGFSNITVGSNTAGTISFSGATSYNDSVVFRSANDIVMNASASLTGGVGQNAGLTFHSDADASGAGGISIGSLASITTNNGALVFGGGNVDPLTGFAMGTAATGNAGINILGSINTGTGNVTMHGQSALGSGILFGGGTLTSNGTVNITGTTSAAGVGSAATTVAGVNFRNAGTRLTTATGTVAINGTTSSNFWSQGVTVDAATIETTGSGTLTLSGTNTSIAPNAAGWGIGINSAALVRSTGVAGGTLTFNGNSVDWSVVLFGGGGITSNGGAIASTAFQSGTFFDNGSTVNAGASGSISLTTNGLTINPTASLQAAGGTLAIQPFTAGTAIDIGGATAPLQLLSSYFSTNFVDGFSGITIGSANTGNIISNGFSYSDNLILWAGSANATATLGGAISNVGVGASSGSLTVKAAGDIVQSAAATITTQNQAVTFNSDSDASGSGAINLGLNASISTNGGNIVMGGGANPLTTSTFGNATYNQGVWLDAGSSLLSAGGNISIRGTGLTSGGLWSWGVYSNSIINSGAGTVLIDGFGPAIGAGINSIGATIGGSITSANTTAGAISITGRGPTAGVNSNAAAGINFWGSVLATNGGGITFNGTGGTTSTSFAYGINMANASILSTGGAISLTGNSPAGFADINMGGGVTIGQKVGTAVTASTSNITLNANTLTMTGTDFLQSSGALTIQPRTAGTTIGIGGAAGTMQLLSSYFSTNFVSGFAGITVGNPLAGAITLGGATSVNDSLQLVSGGSIGINAALTQAVGKTLTLTAGNTFTAGGIGNITATNLLLNGINANYTLNTAAANNVGTLAATGIAGLSFTNSAALNIGTVAAVNGISASGIINVVTNSGDLTVAQNIVTTDATNAAIFLNAGMATAAGTATGGNIVISGAPTITTGAGGRATLMTGGVAASTGVSTLAGLGNSRYNSDEVTTGYTAALGAGTFAIYREQPIVSITATAAAKIYDGLAYSGGNGVTYAGFVNGDTLLDLTGALTYGGTSQGAINAGAYLITPSGLGNGLGYALGYTSGTLTVNSAPLIVAANPVAKIYDGLAFAGGNGVTYAGFVNGETVAVLGGGLAYGGTSQGALNAGNYLITPSGLTSGNYTVNYVDGVLTITAAPVTAPAAPAAPLPPVVSSPSMSNIPVVTTTAALSGILANSNTPFNVTPANSAPTASSNNSQNIPSGTNIGAISNTAGAMVTPTVGSGSAAIGGTANAATGTGQGIGPKTSQPASGINVPMTANTLMANLASSGNPADAVNAFSNSLVQIALSKGMSPEQARLAGSTYSAAMVNEVSLGVPVGDAMAKAVLAFSTDVSLVPPSSPQETLGRVLGAGGNDLASLGSVHGAQSPSGAVAFDQALSVALSQGMSVDNALKAGLVAEQRADGMARADSSPQSLLSNGNAAGRLANSSAAFQKALSGLVASGTPLDQAIRRATQLAGDDAAAASNDARSPSFALASGDFSALDGFATAGSFGKTLSFELARGVPVAEALTRSVQAATDEQRAIASDARNPSVAFASGDRLPEKRSATFDKALANELLRGEKPDLALARAQRVAISEEAAQPTPHSALASGEAIESLLLGNNSSLTYRRVLGNALARGMPLAQAVELAKRAESANAFRFSLPSGLASKVAANIKKVSVSTMNGKSLPSWLKFNPKLGEFVSFEVPAGALPMAVMIHVGNKDYQIEVLERTTSARNS